MNTTPASSEIFNRTELLAGSDGLQALSKATVILFGVGGVGSWTAEALIRSGIRTLTIVDPDSVATSNINRQLPALCSTIGKSKVEVMRRRLLEINPDAKITALPTAYTSDTAEQFNLNDYDYVIDAIDSLSDKATLINNATRSATRLFSSMGAALKMNPERIAVAEFYKVTGCRLASALRNKFKRIGIYPAKKFKCVYSDEVLQNRGNVVDTSGAMTFGKVVTNGAMCHITAIFGFTLASLVIRHILTPQQAAK